MQNTTVALSPSSSITTMLKLKPSNKTTTHFLHPLSPRSYCSVLLLHLPSNHVLPSSYYTAVPSCTFRNSSSYSIFMSKRRDKIVKVLAASLSESAGETVRPSRLIQALRLGAMFGIWYILNSCYNIFNKQVLKVYPFPATVTTIQFAIASAVIMFMWSFNIHHRPKIRRSQLAAIIPLAIAHTSGNLLTNVSLGRVAVSFTHTIKAMEPFFTVVLSVLFLGEWPSFWVVSSLVPLVGGVALASMTEVSFNWIGFCSAMASNLTNQSRNVLSKKLMVNEEETLDNINLFSVITVISFILLVPVTIFMEGLRFTPSYLQLAASQGLNVRKLLLRSVLAGFCFHAYQQVSYGILQMVSPVSHSVGNCVKRVVVIVTSVIFFRTPVSLINSIGTATALVGVFLYSRAKQIKTKPKTS